MDRTDVVKILNFMADLLDLESDNPFRSRSFRSGARALEGLAGDLSQLVEARELTSVKGIGESIAAVIADLLTTGSTGRLDELLEAIPEGVRDMLSIAGLGPKKIRVIWKEMGIEDIEVLAEACREGRLAGFKGFGAKSEAKILQGIDYMESVSGMFLRVECEKVAAELLDYVAGCTAVDRVEVAGSYRRAKEVMKDLDLVISTADPAAVVEHICSWPRSAEVVARGESKTSLRCPGGLGVDFRIVEDSQFPFALCHFTGSKEHNTAMRARAKKQGLKLNEYGLFRGDELAECGSEEEIHRALGLDFIAAELRENFGEIELAADSSLPELVEEADIRGLVHLHTDYSDGEAGIEEMAEAARARGLSYMGVTDHSQSAFYAGGLKPDDVKRQHEEIDSINASMKDFRIFKGIESDILADGSLDYEDEVLELFDFVIASLHSSFNQPLEEMTNRVLRAIANPYTTMLGHVTTRLLLRRDGVALDMEKILTAASADGVVVEVNANPRRLDLDWRHGPRARELGLLTSVNPDAHTVEGIGDIRFGVGIARKAGFEASRVVNTLDADSFGEFIGRRRA
ncbi:MAG: DNA polymerase/3'-5' exonuclease PolX [Planctomycetota bacterium]|nr:DNA polymerase/3'-5' exonuclease PolX [Planctomycetota bacterium]